MLSNMLTFCCTLLHFIFFAFKYVKMITNANAFNKTTGCYWIVEKHLASEDKQKCK